MVSINRMSDISIQVFVDPDIYRTRDHHSDYGDDGIGEERGFRPTEPIVYGSGDVILPYLSRGGKR